MDFIYLWRNKVCQDELREQLQKSPIVKKAKNVIFFMGDGASVTTFTAARFLRGQRTGNGERQVLEWEKFPDSCLIKVWLF